MKKAPSGQALSTVSNDSSMPIHIDSPELRSLIEVADIVRADDPQLKGGIVFHGRELLEEIIRSRVARTAKVVKVILDFTSDDPERLDALIRELKGNSSFRPEELFPEIEIDTASFTSAPDLLAPIRLAVDVLRTKHRSLLPLMQRRFYYDVRAGGFSTANEALREGTRLAQKLGSTETAQAYIVCMVTLGEVLYGQLRAEAIQRTRCVDVRHCEGADDRKLVIRCRSLRSTETPAGRAYFSRRMPRLRFGTDRRDGLIAFSKHALERVCKRTVYNWRTYSGHADAFAFLDNCVYFEDCTAVRGEPSFVVYNSCVPHFPSWQFVEHVLGGRFSSHGDIYADIANAITQRLYYRVGYCPVEFHGDIAVAKTLLVPGMKEQRGTPEGLLIERSGLPAHEVARLQEQVERQLSLKDVVDGGDFTLVKWFHENGIPQVVEIKEDVFKYD